MSSSTAITMSKDPHERLDYDIDFERWLSSGDTIASAVVTRTGTVATIDATEVSSTAVKVWILGGTAAENGKVTVQATTAQGRVKEVSFNLRIRET